jgi:DNA-binding winged helix-turn-helix (wHTH) protein/TolB-like protein
MATDQPTAPIYEFNGFRVDAAKRLLVRAPDVTVPLTPKVFDTLLYLARHSGKVIEKDELMREIWPDSIVEENNLTQNISVLRRSLGEKPGEQTFIATVTGHGYRFVPEVTVINADESNRVVERSSAAGPHLIQGDKNRSDHRIRIVAVAAFAVLALSAFGFFLRRSDQKSPGAPITSLAVLPFKPLVPENRNEALEFGLADSLISKLSGSEDIVVRPLSAIRQYSSVDQDSLEAARELGVESILDGTIQTWGERIRISAKLVRTSDGKQLWSEQFDERFDDIFAIQDAISARVATAIRIRLSTRGKKHSTDNLEAYRLYMLGRYHTAKGTPADLRASIPYFQQAIDLDPAYALAYTGLAQAYGVLGIFGAMPVAQAFPKAKAAEQRALELDDSLAEAHIARCMGLFWYEWDWRSAEKECRRGIELDPNNSASHGHFAMVLSNTGRHGDALAEVQRSLELNPLDLTQNALKGQFLLHAGRTDDALEHLRKVTELEPRFPLSYLFAASAYIEKGMFVEAVGESKKEYEITGRSEIPFGAFALARSGRQAEARAVLDQLLARSTNSDVPAYNIAMIFNGLGEQDHALDWLEKGYEQRDPKMTFLKVEPKWNDLRSLPRFVDLMKRMNL